MSKFSIAFWGLGSVFAIAVMLARPEEVTSRDVVMSLLCLGFLVLSIWVAYHDWLLNDKGVWDKLRRAIEKDRPELAARCIHSVLKDGSVTCKDDVAEHLLMSLRKERWKVASAMLSAGAANPAILTPPHFLALGVLENCVAEGNEPAVRLLLEHGALPDAGTDFPPLLYAQVNGRQDIADLLLAHGAAPQGTNPDFNPDRITALHLFCSKRGMKEADITTAARLLQEGADINARTQSGFTPLDVAMDSRFSTGTAHPELLDFLRTQGAESGARLSVPQASYNASVLMKGERIELPPQSHGCELRLADRALAAPIPHEWQVLLQCYSTDNESPLAAAHRLALAVQELCRSELAVAADLGAGYTPAPEIAAAEQPLLCMLKFHPSDSENRTGLETEGMARFGLPELRATDSPNTHRDWLIYAICHVVNSFIEHNMSPVIEHRVPVGEMEDDDLWCAEEVFSLRSCCRQQGEGPCLEIIHNYL